MAPHLKIILCAFGIYLLVGLVIKLLPQRKVKDEPIPGLRCKFCGKKQTEVKQRFEECPHVWEEEKKV